MRIADLNAQPGVVHQQAAVLLVEGFDHPQGWPNPESATMEVERVLHEGFAFGALEDALLLGWIGGLPQYDGRVWELHPLVVRRDVTGIMPDANGPGRPDIYMSKPARSEGGV